jgi:catecholate siderophore receptor
MKNLMNHQLTALIMAHGLAAVADAQDTGAKPAAPKTPPVNNSTNAPAKLPEVVVQGTQEKEPSFQPEAVASPRYTQPLRDTPQTINVIPRTVIESQGATTLRDVLRNVPGISFQAGEGGVPAGDQMSIRGFSARTDMFIDGVRDVGGYTRDSFNIEQVEVIKGPNSTYSGRGSTGGSVNMVSKSPKQESFYTADLSVGNANYKRVAADFNTPIHELDKYVDGAAIRFNGMLHDQDFAGRDFIHDQRWALAPSLAFGLGTDTRVILSYVHLQENNLAGYGLPFVNNSNNPYGGNSAVGHVAPLPYNRFLGLALRDYEDIYNDSIGARVEHDFSEDLKLRHQTRYVRTYRDSIITAPRVITNPLVDPTPGFAGNPIVVGANTYGLNHELQARDMTDQVFSTQTDLTAKFNTARLEHTLVGSFEYSHETSINYLRSATAGTLFPYPAALSNPQDPNPYDPHHPVFRTGAHNDTTADSFGVSVGDTIKITDQWLLSLSARVDTFDLTYDQYAATGALTRLQRFDWAPTWRSGFTYKPLPNGSIYFGYGTAFNPSAEGLTLAANTAVLEPELSESYELGSKWDLFDERLSVSGAMFRTDKSNFRNTDLVTGLLTASGDVRVQGVEFGIAGVITRGWNVYAGYALQESKILKSGTTTTYNGVAIREQGHALSNTPEQTASISTTYDLTKALTLGTGFQFVDKRYSNNIETQGADGYWLQDAAIAWKVSDHFSLRLNGSNLWDAKYIDRVGGGHAIPGTGRTFILTASLKF